MKGAGRLLFSSRKLGWRWQRLVLYINTIYMSHLPAGLQVPVAVQNVILAYLLFVFWKHFFLYSSTNWIRKAGEMENINKSDK